MYSGFGIGRTGKAGAGGGQGFGFRGSSPPWPYVGRGRGGLPRCSYFTGNQSVASATPGVSPTTKEEEINMLKNQAKAVKGNLDRINSRLNDLESGK